MSGRALMPAFVILCSVAESYGLTSGDLLGRNRRVEIVTARHAAMAIIRSQLKMTHKHTAEVFGLGHAMSIHAHKNVCAWLETDAKFREKFVEVMGKAIKARRALENEFQPPAVV